MFWENINITKILKIWKNIETVFSYIAQHYYVWQVLFVIAIANTSGYFTDATVLKVKCHSESYTSIWCQIFLLVHAETTAQRRDETRLTSWSRMALSCSSFFAQYRASSSGMSVGETHTQKRCLSLRSHINGLSNQDIQVRFHIRQFLNVT